MRRFRLLLNTLLHASTDLIPQDCKYFGHSSDVCFTLIKQLKRFSHTTSRVCVKFPTNLQGESNKSSKDYIFTEESADCSVKKCMGREIDERPVRTIDFLFERIVCVRYQHVFLKLYFLKRHLVYFYNLEKKIDNINASIL